jgi:hypothetical protein
VLYDAVAGTCHVVVRLANGDGYAFSVEFRNRTLAGACGCDQTYAVDASPPELVDAGTSD